MKAFHSSVRALFTVLLFTFCRFTNAVHMLGSNVLAFGGFVGGEKSHIDPFNNRTIFETYPQCRSVMLEGLPHSTTDKESRRTEPGLLQEFHHRMNRNPFAKDIKLSSSTRTINHALPPDIQCIIRDGRCYGTSECCEKLYSFVSNNYYEEMDKWYGE